MIEGLQRLTARSAAGMPGSAWRALRPNPWGCHGKLITLFQLTPAEWNRKTHMNGRPSAGHSTAERNSANILCNAPLFLPAASPRGAGVASLPESSFWLAPDPIRLQTWARGDVEKPSSSSLDSHSPLQQHTCRRHRELALYLRQLHILFISSLPLPPRVSHSLRTQALIQNSRRRGAEVTKCKKRLKQIWFTPCWQRIGHE